MRVLSLKRSGVAVETVSWRLTAMFNQGQEFVPADSNRLIQNFPRIKFWQHFVIFSELTEIPELFRTWIKFSCRWDQFCAKYYKSSTLLISNVVERIRFNHTAAFPIRLSEVYDKPMNLGFKIRVSLVWSRGTIPMKLCKHCFAESIINWK